MIGPVDAHELVVLTDALRYSPAATLAAIQATTTRAVKNIQREAQSLAPHGPHTPQYAGKITTSTKKRVASFEAEVGPLQSGQGALGEVFEFGTATTPPHPHLMPAADHEVPTWLRYVTEAGGAGI